MSYTTLYAIGKDGLVEHHSEYRNAWGYAVPVWGTIAEKYLGRSLSQVMCDGADDLWNLKTDPRLSDTERTLLVSTFDAAVVKKENFEALAEAFDAFHREYRAANADSVCHYAELASVLRELAKDEEVIGVAWNATSVSQSHWSVRDECECPKCGNSHDTEEPRPYDISRDEDHFFLFEALGELAGQKGGSR